MTNNAVFKLKRRVTTIVGGAGIGLSTLVDTLRNMRCPETGDALDFSKQIVDQISPMTEHVDDDPTTVFLAIIPARPLRWLVGVLTRENPVTKLPSHRENLAEESLMNEHP